MSCRDLLRAIALGDEREAAPGRARADGGDKPRRSLAAGEDGMISLVAIVTVLFFLILAMLVANLALMVNQKVEVQNAADSITISAGTQMARGMNAVTAMNHLIGELLAIVVLHDAVAGDRPNEVDAQDDPTINEVIKTMAKMVDGPIAADQVSKEVKAEAAVLDSKKRLKDWLIKVYIGRIICKLLKNVPIIGPIFVAIDAVLLVIEGYILAEWMALEGFEIAAKITDPAVRLLFNIGLPAAAGAARLIPIQTRALAYDTAQAMGKLNYVKAALYPERPGLPLMTDPLASASSKEEIKRSQLTRASWPLVAYHRQLIFDITGWMVFSQMRKHYREHTEGYMLKKSFEAYTERYATLQVLALMQPDQKGREPWTSIPPLADQYFAFMGFARRNAPTPEGRGVFRQANPAGLVAFAQAILYNANGRDPDNGPPSLQPAVGWDTLNWKPVRDDPLTANREAYEYPNYRQNMPCPVPLLNWQVKLTPATRIGQAKNAVPADFRDALKVINPSSSLARTH